MKTIQLILATIFAGAIASMVKTLPDNKVSEQELTPSDNPAKGELRALSTASAWLNSEPLTAARLRGKVVLIDFWTYSCINWIRTIPYVRAWAHKYRDQGLVVIGVHTPEFSFEKKLDNVRWAVKDMSLAYPIAIDNDYTIWDAFDNQYWPALYFVDAKGNLRHHHFGEGEYEQSERVIQQLLKEAGATGVDNTLVSVEGSGAEAGADWNNLKTPENYVGYARTENFASRGIATFDKSHVYTAPGRLRLNQWALAGEWTMHKEHAVVNGAGGRIVYRFHARDLHLVMGPANAGMPVRFRVSIDGQPPMDAHGIDVDKDGNGSISEQRLYQLIRQTTAVRERQFEIEFLAPGAEVFVFTFG